jgi:hypothetical protein
MARGGCRRGARVSGRQRVQAVALGQEMLESPVGRVAHGPSRLVARPQDSPGADRLAAVLDAVFGSRDRHPRVSIREPVREAGGEGRGGAAASRLKNQMPGRPPIVVYVRTLSSGNRDSQGSGGRARGCAPMISKRRDADPCGSVVAVDRDGVRDHRAQRRFGEPPVREEQVDPALAHHPWPMGEWERAVTYALERCALAAGRGDRFDGPACWRYSA